MKTKYVMISGIVCTILGAIALDNNLPWTGNVLLWGGAVLAVMSPVIAGACNTNNGEGF
jgi:hypothetical protein